MTPTSDAERPRLNSRISRPLSTFICPCRCIEADRIQALMARADRSIAQPGCDELVHIQLPELEFNEECIGLKARLTPQLFFFPDVEWMALALEAEFHPITGGSISFEQLLAFNSNWRVCKGGLWRPDDPALNGRIVRFTLSSGRTVAEAFRDVALEVLGSFEPPAALTRAITLSMAHSERPLSDSDLYSFGTIAHSDEIVDPDWAAEVVRGQVHDRWRRAGIRLLVHSYSLVASCSPPELGPGQDLDWFRAIFRRTYMPMGARVAIERAGLLKMASTIHDIRDVRELREHRGYWVGIRRTLGLRWTAEKTQGAQVERMWRDISGLRHMSDEVDRCLDQTVGVFEAEATGRLNRLMGVLTVIIGGFAAAQITVGLTHDYSLIRSLPWIIGTSVGVAVALLLWLRWRWGKDNL